MSMAAFRPRSEPPLIVVMGVSGSGKTSVGKRLAARLGLPFVEGDRFHPPGNIEKMSSGVPLDDDDRWPWLDLIGAELARARAAGDGLIVSCSALKKSYRDRLRRATGGPLQFVFLGASREVLRERLADRRDHFMPASLLDSQLATLEDPRGEADVIAVDIDATVDEIVEEALRSIEARDLRGVE
jgi:gluconokinase